MCLCNADQMPAILSVSSLQEIIGSVENIVLNGIRTSLFNLNLAIQSID